MALDSTHTFGFFVKPAGGSFADHWARVKAGSVSLTDQEGAAIDTLRIAVEDYDLTLSFVEWAECYLIADGTTKYFGGYLTRVKPVAAAKDTTRIWELTCESYVTRLARAPEITKTYVNKTLKYIVGDLFTTAGLSDFDAATNVATGPTITSFHADKERLPGLLDRLTLLGQLDAGATWTWQIDAAKALWLGPASARPAPFGITTIAAANWTTTFPPDTQPDVETDASILFNRVKVRGGAATQPEVTETFSGDGVTLIFQLAHAPVRRVVRVTVDGALQWHGTDWYHTWAAGYNCLVNYAAGTVRWPDGSPPAVGTNNISVTYTYDDQTAVSVTVTDAASVTKYGLTLDAPDIYDPSITTAAEATALGQALLSEFANGVVQGTFVVERLGLQAGQLVHVELPLFGLDADYAIRQVTTELDKAGTGVVATVKFGGRADSLSAAVGGGGGSWSGGGVYGNPNATPISGEVDVLTVRTRIELLDPLTAYVEP